MRVTSPQVVDLEGRSESRAEFECRSVGHRDTSSDTSPDTVPAITAVFLINAHVLGLQMAGGDIQLAHGQKSTPSRNASSDNRYIFSKRRDQREYGECRRLKPT